MRKDLRDNPRGLPQTTFPPSEPRRPGRRTAVPARPFALARSRQPPGTGAPHAPALPPAERSGVGDEDRERPRGFRGGRLGCPARAASEGAGPLPPLALSRLSPIASRPEPTRSSRPTALLTALLARDLVSLAWVAASLGPLPAVRGPPRGMQSFSTGSQRDAHDAPAGAPVSAALALGNDPSAGSPTETLLRLLLPLDSPV